MTNTIATTAKVTDLKVGDSYFIYGVEQVIVEINPITPNPIEDNAILFKSNNGYRTFKNHLTTKAILR